MRRVPEIRFMLDKTMEQAERVRCTLLQLVGSCKACKLQLVCQLRCGMR